MKNYIEPNPESGKRFYLEYQGKGRIVMLNLLKFKEIADYSENPQLQPESNISGMTAYHLYMNSVVAEFKAVGSRIIYFGSCSNYLIGPEPEKWDAVLLVEHESVDKFMSFTQNESYLKNLGHRTAALEDSRLLPSTEIPKD